MSLPSPTVPISWGELIDKITILEIKAKNLSSPSALFNVRKELQILESSNTQASFFSGAILDLKNQLSIVNLKLWEIEDSIREKEHLKLFDNEFIELARSVYKTNDIRSRIKRTINELMNSEIIEEKSYRSY